MDEGCFSGAGPGHTQTDGEVPQGLSGTQDQKFRLVFHSTHSEFIEKMKVELISKVMAAFHFACVQNGALQQSLSGGGCTKHLKLKFPLNKPDLNPP